MSVRTYGNPPGRLSSDTGTEDTPFFSTNAPLSEYVLHRLSVIRTVRISQPSSRTAHWTVHTQRRSSMALIPIRGTQLCEDHMQKATLPKTQHEVSALEGPCTHAPKQLAAHSLGDLLPARHPPMRQKHRAYNHIDSSNNPGSMATFTLYCIPAWHSAVLH